MKKQTRYTSDLKTPSLKAAVNHPYFVALQEWAKNIIKKIEREADMKLKTIKLKCYAYENDYTYQRTLKINIDDIYAYHYCNKSEHTASTIMINGYYFKCIDMVGANSYIDNFYLGVLEKDFIRLLKFCENIRDEIKERDMGTFEGLEEMLREDYKKFEVIENKMIFDHAEEE